MTSLKVGNIDLNAFQILSIGIGCVLGVVTSVVSRWSLITCGLHFGQPFVKCLKGFNLAFISANMTAIVGDPLGWHEIF